MTMTEIHGPADVISTEMILRLFEIQPDVLLNLFNMVLNEEVSMVTPLFTQEGIIGGFSDDVSLTLFCMGGGGGGVQSPLSNFVDHFVLRHDTKLSFP